MNFDEPSGYWKGEATNVLIMIACRSNHGGKTGDACRRDECMPENRHVYVLARMSSTVLVFFRDASITAMEIPTHLDCQRGFSLLKESNRRLSHT